MPGNVSETAAFRAGLEGWGAGEGGLFLMDKANGAKANRERREAKGIKYAVASRERNEPFDRRMAVRF
ncbi:MAG: hypothetical protein LBQ12_15140 [Deltaproteobacteria bacterium]|nr:hypothetical protein [Deltaproteobacteria bacterium]